MRADSNGKAVAPPAPGGLFAERKKSKRKATVAERLATIQLASSQCCEKTKPSWKEEAKIGPRQAKMRPRRAQDEAKKGQNRAKMGPRWARMGPVRAKMGRSWAKNGPRWTRCVEGGQKAGPR